MLDNAYEERVIRITELVSVDGILDGFTFRGCHLEGPAILVLRDSTMMTNDLGGPSLDAILWEVRPERSTVVGAILAVNCAFYNCQFRNIGFAGPRTLLDEFRRNTP